MSENKIEIKDGVKKGVKIRENSLITNEIKK
jgi:hypothetical protein